MSTLRSGISSLVPCSAGIVHRCGVLGVVGGVTFVPYALTKASIAGTIKSERMSLFGLPPEDLATLLHLSETLPVVLLALGLFGFVRSRHGGFGVLGRLGTGVTFLGFASVLVTHTGEHLLPTVPVPGLPGHGGVFVYGYLLSWLLLGWGFFLLGLGAWSLDGRHSPATLALVIALPAGVGIGLAAVASGTYTFAGVNRLVYAGVGTTVGYQLWSHRGEPPAASSSAGS